jgi:hypothetical protein
MYGLRPEQLREPLPQMACRSGLAYDRRMRRADALKLIGAHRDELRALRVRSLSIFGSAARDEARADSDIDLIGELRDGIFAEAIRAA